MIATAVYVSVEPDQQNNCPSFGDIPSKRIKAIRAAVKNDFELSNLTKSMNFASYLLT